MRQMQNGKQAAFNRQKIHQRGRVYAADSLGGDLQQALLREVQKAFQLANGAFGNGDEPVHKPSQAHCPGALPETGYVDLHGE